MITPSETLQLNELLTLKSLSLTKALLMSPMITDTELKDILTRETGICENHMNELKDYMELSNVKNEKTVNNSAEDGRIEA